MGPVVGARVVFGSVTFDDLRSVLIFCKVYHYDFSVWLPC